MLTENVWSDCLPTENTGRESDSDAIKRDDGPARYWMFLNGEQARLFSALAAALFGVGWCFLYILGAGKSPIGIALQILVVVSLLTCWLFDKKLREYEENDWHLDKRRSKVERLEMRIAVFLWLFILVSISVIFLLQWLHGH